MTLRVRDSAGSSAPAGEASGSPEARPGASPEDPGDAWGPQSGAPAPRTGPSTFETPAAPPPPPTRLPTGFTATQLGYLSGKYEAGGDVGAVGWDSTGGASYGIYQLATSNGSAEEFIAWLAGAAPALSQKLTDAPGTPAFSAAWKALAQSQRDAFVEAQNAYVYANRYFYTANAIRQATGLDVLTAPLPLQQALWSTTVQHGVGGASIIFRAALARQQGDPSAVLDWQAGSTAVDAGRLIHDLYYERGMTDATGSEARFRNSTLAVQHSVADRFSNERTEALQEYLGAALAGMTAGQAMTMAVTSFKASDTVKAARGKLTTTAGPAVHFSSNAAYAHHDFPVLDAQGKPLGMVSNRALLDPSRDTGATLGALAHRPALTVPLSATLDDVVQRMLKAGVGHVVVVDEQGRLAGVISSSDLLKARRPPTAA